jgi:peptide/nickel transport system permease protein
MSAPFVALSPSGFSARTLLGLGRELWRDKPGFVGFVLVLLLVAVALLAPFLAPHDPGAVNLRARLVPPFWAERGRLDFPLGTDHLGRCVLSRVIWGAQVSMAVGAAVVALAGSFGVAVGVIAGYLGGRTDAIAMRLVDIQVAFPGLLLALVILAVVGPSVTTVIMVLALNGWMVFARLARAVVLSVRETPYVEAAEIIGAKPARVIVRHILPNLASPMLTLFVLEFARVVLAEAALSFLGVGVQPPATSWGLDVANGKNYIFNAWWLVTFPGLAIALTVLGVNLFASWLRLIADPFEREKMHARGAGASGA